jgi:PIN domain
VYDACVLYPAPLRDFMMWLALSGAFRARWSAQIHHEWKRNLLENRPDLTSEQIDRTIFMMNDAVPGAVVTEYEFLVEGLVLPDPDDRHVLGRGHSLQRKCDRHFQSNRLSGHNTRTVGNRGGLPGTPDSLC